MNWQPTCEFKYFAQEYDRLTEHDPVMLTMFYGSKIYKLKQKWVHYAQWGDIDDEEWRDIPVEKEA